MNFLHDFYSSLSKLNENTFEDIALELFQLQALQNPVYKAFLANLGIQANKIHSIVDIPFLPISFFKTQRLKTGNWESSTYFTSSGTTGATTSLHQIYDLPFYLNHSKQCFQQYFGPLDDYCILALLPSYLERSNSSLVAMIDFFIKSTGEVQSGFYLHNVDQLLMDLDILRDSRKKTILWGVSYALLDLAEKYRPDLSHTLIFETGGMKGKRREITREELHQTLCKGLNVDKIFSEYGMTEMLSQAYTKGGSRFYCPPSMRVLGRNTSDPLEKGLFGQTAGINVIDLANAHSIAFIETEDMGKVYTDGSFEVLGRFDNSDIRGCNLMVE